MQVCSRLALWFGLSLLVACGGGGSSGGSANNSSNNTPGGTPQLSVEPTRVSMTGGEQIQLMISLTNGSAAVTGAASSIQVNATSGSLTSVVEVGNGQYSVTLTAPSSGEYPVSIAYSGQFWERTLLSFPGYDSSVGVAMAVPGLVNTPGYEDGVTVTEDGEYVFVQYGPIYFGGIFLFGHPRNMGGAGGNRLEFPTGTPNVFNHPWIDDTIGPVGAPERPGFFDGRIANGKLLHNSILYNVPNNGAPNFAPMTMFYGFKRQADGTYREPFYLAFSDQNDGIINPYGLSFALKNGNQVQLFFALDDATDPDMVDFDNDGTDDAQSLADIFTMPITLGQNTSLGTFTAATMSTPMPQRGTPFPSQLVNFGKTGIDGIAGTQGNPHVFTQNGAIHSIWTDDERDTGGDRGELSVYVLNSGSVTTGNWTKVVLPNVVNEPDPVEDIQPFFTGTELYFTRISPTALPEIFRSEYSGPQTVAGYSNAANWTTPVKLVTIGNSQLLNQMTAIGEPTVATIGSKRYLFFVYGYVRGFDAGSGIADVNMQAGFIELR